MKKLTFILLILGMFVKLFPQSPEKMSYQCVIRNTNGDLVTNQSVGIRISILQTSLNGTIVYQETYSPNPQTNANGLVTVEIGGGVPIVGSFATINWSSGLYFLKTETDPTGGTNYTISGTSQLLSVPYAFHAKTADNGFSGAWADITGKPTTFEGYSLTEADGSITNELQTLNLSGTQLTLSNGGGTVTLPSSGGGDNWGTQAVVTNNSLTGTGTASSPLSVVNTVITPSWANIQDKPGFSTVAISGNYNDLLNRPIIFSGDYNELTNRPALFSGSWTDITNKPTTLSGYGITDGVSSSKIIKGVVDGNNRVIIRGEGFTYSYIETGHYRITFLNPFYEIPIAVATDNGSANYIIGATPTEDYVEIWVRAHNGSEGNTIVSFIVVGD